MPRGSASGGGVPTAIDFEGQWGSTAGAPQDWGKQRLHSWRAHTRTQGKSGDSTGAWARITCWSWKVSCGGGAVEALSGVIKAGGRHSRNLRELWLEADILGPLTETWSQPTAYKLQGWDTSSQKPKGQEHRPTHQQPGCLKTS